MSIQSLLTTQTEQLEREIRQDVIEIRQELERLGYRLKQVYKESREGLIFCAAYELAAGSSLDHVIAYVRVSMYQQSGGHSLVTQMLQMMTLAEERDQVIAHVYVEAGVSGADSGRPAFQAMLREVTRSEGNARYAAVFCYDLYRFYRNLLGLVSTYNTLSDHGVDLVSVAAKDTDLNTDLGQLLLYLRGIMGEMYLKDLKRTVADNKLKRAMQGYSNASVAPFGYCRGTCFQCNDNQGEGYCPRFGDRQDLWRELGDDPKVFVPHPIDQHAVRLAMELSNTGTFSDSDLARRLSRPWPDDLASIDLDARTVVKPLEEGRALVELEDGTFAIQHADGRLQFFRPQGRPGCKDPDRRFSRDAIRDMLQNPYYAGFVVYRSTTKGKGRREQKHKRFKLPLSNLSRREQEDALLSNDHGMLFLGHHIPLVEVGAFEKAQQQRGLRGRNSSNATTKRRIYPLSGVLRCSDCGYPFRGNAANGRVRYYEDGGRARGVSDCSRRLVRAEPIEEAVFARVARLRIPKEWDENLLLYLQEGEVWDDLRRERRAIHSRLSAGKEMLNQGILSMGEYEELADRCQRRLEILKRKVQVEGDRYRAMLRDFPQLWAAASNKERKGLIRCVFSRILLEDGEVVGYKVREPFKGLLPNLKSVPHAGEIDHVADGLA